MIFRLEAVPEEGVRRYFLQVPALLNSLVSGFTLLVRFSNTVIIMCIARTRGLPAAVGARDTERPTRLIRYIRP
jgi:hypothetical protein